MVSGIDFDGRKGIPPDEIVFVHAVGFVLAGGRSTRMGQDKALLTLGGEPLVKRGDRKLSKVCAEVAIAGGAENLMQFGQVIPVEGAGGGAIGGIVAALEQSLVEWNLFVAVEALFVMVSLLQAL